MSFYTFLTILIFSLLFIFMIMKESSLQDIHSYLFKILPIYLYRYLLINVTLIDLLLFIYF